MGSRTLNHRAGEPEAIAVNFIAYYRVSTKRQGESGLGLKAQQAAVAEYIAAHPQRRLVESFQEIESGKRKDRPALAEAIEECQLRRAKLIIAKLDRLARNISVMVLLKDSGVKFVACDNPNINELTVNILASVAQDEARAISERTKAALAQSTKQLGGHRIRRDTGKPWDLGSVATKGRLAGLAKRRAQSQEHTRKVLPRIKKLRDAGATLASIAATLNENQITTVYGRPWSAAAVLQILRGEVAA